MSSRNLAVRRRLILGSPGEQYLFLMRDASNRHLEQPLRIERDFQLLLLQATLALVAWIAPRKWWPKVCTLTSFPRMILRRRKKFAAFSARTSNVLDGMKPADSRMLFAATERRLHERQMTYLGERFSRHRAITEVHGIDRIRSSLERGNGVILWNTPALGDTIITKRALASAGYRAYQLSVRNHGFSQSRFAARYLNPAQIAVENRYLAGRIWFDGADAARATREMMRRLKENESVLIQNSLFAGRSFIAAPFGEQSYLPMATTPLSLAVKMGVPVHVVATVEVEPFTRYISHVSADLRSHAPAACGGDEDEQIALLAQCARDIMLGLLRAYPDQIRLWDRLIDRAELDPGELSTHEHEQSSRFGRP